METHSFRRTSSELPDTLRKLCVSANFSTKELDEISVFYVVQFTFNYKNVKKQYEYELGEKFKRETMELRVYHF